MDIPGAAIGSNVHHRDIWRIFAELVEFRLQPFSLGLRFLRQRIAVVLVYLEEVLEIGSGGGQELLILVKLLDLLF